MAQVMLCENPGHDGPAEGHVLIQFLGSPDTQVCCATCWEEWCWAFIEKLPTFDDRIKTYAGMVIQQYRDEQAGAGKPARKRAAAAGGAKDTKAVIATGESTPGNE